MKLKKMFDKAIQEQFGSGLYTLKYPRLNHMVDDMRRFGALSVLDSSSYNHFNLNIKHAYKEFAGKTNNNTVNDKRNGKKLREGTVLREERG